MSGPNSKITGANFFLVMPSGVSAILRFRVSWFPLLVFSFSESISNESSVLSKISVSLVSGPISLYGRSTFLYGVPGL